MIRLFAKQDVRCTLADYSKSGDLTGDYSTSVSYAALVFTTGQSTAPGPIGLGAAEQKLLLELARSTLQGCFAGKRALPGSEDRFSSFPPALRQNLGVFVTLRKKDELRGCIGTIIGMEPLCRGVEANAMHAAFDDPRFPPLTERELGGIEIEISVMTPLRQVRDYRSIRLGTDGVIVRDGSAQAVFLPQVAAETGWTLDQFLANLCLKAGLERDAYRRSPTMQFQIFQAQVFSEKDGKQ
jgi:AmmeMemoRadiSam system protein A